jgi:chromosome transmission fidelity protein 18
VESHGEYDKLMNGCFENYLNMKFREQHGFGSNIVQLHEYLNFYDLLSSKMHFGGNGLFAYVPYVFCVFNRLCSHIGNPNMLKLEYPRADAQAFMARRTNESVISSVLSHVDSRVMSWIRTGRCLILDVLSYLLRIMSPAIRPVNIQLLKAKEKAVLNRLVRIMASFRLNYIQVSVVESSGSGNSSVGGYTFKLEP